MNAIDIHAHAFPDAVAPRAIRELEARAEWHPVSDGTITGLLADMDAAGVDVAAVCPIATRPDQVEGILQWCRTIRSDRIAPLPSPHPDAPDVEQWIRRFADEGFRGVKLHPMYQDFVVDDPRMAPVFGALADCGLFAVMHCGFDVCFPTDERAQPVRLRRLIDRHPNLKLVCTHLGGLRSWDEVERHVLGTDTYLGTSYSFDELGLERAGDLIRRHGPHRVLFGTDWPWKSLENELDMIERLDLTRAEKDAIRHANAAKLLGC